VCVRAQMACFIAHNNKRCYTIQTSSKTRIRGMQAGRDCCPVPTKSQRRINTVGMQHTKYIGVFLIPIDRYNRVQTQIALCILYAIEALSQYSCTQLLLQVPMVVVGVPQLNHCLLCLVCHKQVNTLELRLALLDRVRMCTYVRRAQQNGQDIRFAIPLQCKHLIGRAQYKLSMLQTVAFEQCYFMAVVDWWRFHRGNQIA
jgi:hypothetical protein